MDKIAKAAALTGKSLAEKAVSEKTLRVLNAFDIGLLELRKKGPLEPGVEDHMNRLKLSHFNSAMKRQNLGEAPELLIDPLLAVKTAEREELDKGEEANLSYLKLLGSLEDQIRRNAKTSTSVLSPSSEALGKGTSDDLDRS